MNVINKKLLIFLISFALPFATLAAKPDWLLGAPFLVHEIKTEKYSATLIEYPRTNPPRGILLYLHGYNDYFFQRELAEKADSAGFAFFAIDLHNYGRSIKNWDDHCNMHSTDEFYPEIDSTVAITKSMVGDSLPFILMGHSQGGLIMSLYANDRPHANFSAVVLNSPFLEFHLGTFMRTIAIPAVAKLGYFFPDIKITGSTNMNYNMSISKSNYGEWDINPSAKDLNPKSQSFSWIRAIHLAQNRIKKGLHINYPTLVLFSDCSVDNEEYIDEYNRCDGVLNVEDINRYGKTLGVHVEMQEIPGALHDVFLSKKSVRENAYKKTFDFIDSVLSNDHR